MRNSGLDEAQAGIKIAGRNINDLRYAHDTTLMAESDELKSLLLKVKEESEEVGLKLNFQKTKIMASGPTTSWQIEGKTMEKVRGFILGDFKLTADGDCSHEIKKPLLLGTQVMTNLDSILKSRDITLAMKVHLVKAVGFPVVMYGCESWTVKLSAEALMNFGVEKTLKSPLNFKKIQPVHPKGLVLKLKLQYFGQLMWKTDSFENILMLGKIEGGRRSGRHRMKWFDGISDLMDTSLNNLLEFVMDCVLQTMGVARSWTWLSNWTELKSSWHELSVNSSS